MSRLTVRVIPNASRSDVAGREGSVWKICLAAPPVDGKANDALIRFVAGKLDVAPSTIDIVKGHSSKTKILSVPMAEEDIEAALGA